MRAQEARLVVRLGGASLVTDYHRGVAQIELVRSQITHTVAATLRANAQAYNKLLLGLETYLQHTLEQVGVQAQRHIAAMG